MNFSSCRLNFTVYFQMKSQKHSTLIFDTFVKTLAEQYNTPFQLLYDGHLCFETLI